MLAEGGKTPANAIVVTGRVEEILYHGANRRIDLVTDVGRLTAAVATVNEAPVHEGQSVRAIFSRDALHLMDG